MFDERRIRKHGHPAQATVVSMEQRSGLSSQGYNRYDYVLDVRPTDDAPFRIEMHQTFAILESKPQIYDVVNVKYDEKSHETIFDFTGDPRYDLDAMRAHTAQVRKETAEMKASMAQGGQFGAQGLPFNLPAGAVVISGAGAAGVLSAMGSASADPVAAIERLVALRDSGALSQAEFDALKAKLIGPT